MIAKYVLVLSLFSLILLSGAAEAAMYFALPPNEEVCTSIKFGNDGRGEYTLTVDDPGTEEMPWVDNHYTSYAASEMNIVSVPLCFSSIGRNLGEEAIITATLITPNGKKTFEYGVCVSPTRDVDITSTSAKSPCQAVGDNTDIFSASLTEPRKIAVPGADVSFGLVLDSMTAMTVKITKASGDMKISASQSEVSLGGEPVEVSIGMKAPSAAGEYPFSLMVYADGCEIDDCQREVDGVLVVQSAENQDDSGIMLWLTPETKSIQRDQTTQLTLLVRNYGDGQEITVNVAAEEGAETGFTPYTKFIAKGGNEQVPVYVRVTSDEGERFAVTATAKAADGTERRSKSWIIVDEMENDAELLGSDGLEGKDESDVSLQEWEELKSSSSDSASSDYNPDDFESPSPTPQPDYMLYVVIAVIIAVVATVGFMFYRKSQGGSDNGGLSWKDLGVK